MMDCQVLLGQIKTLDYWALARWGVKNIITLEKTNQIYLNLRRKKKIIIYLNPSDLYDITYGYLNKNHDWKIIKLVKGIYSDQLVEIIDYLLTHKII